MLFNLLGGLGLFIYGMKQMGEGLQKTAGNKLRRLLEMLTTNRIAGVLVGTGITAIIQSSSATTVMVVGFVNAGLMTLKQSIGVIMGANIGTTITAQLIAFKLTHYSFHAIAIGAALYLFGKKRKTKYLGQVFLGFGILFLGLSTMKETMKPLRDSQIFLETMETFGKSPILGVLLGTLMTIMVQSSSASMGILIGLVSVGAINYQIAVPILLGDNIGTTITALLSSVGTNSTAKRSAMAHMIFNVLGTLGFITLLYVIPDLPGILEGFFADFSYNFGGEASASRMLANTHSAFNILNTIIWLPFVGLMCRLVKKLVPEKEMEIKIGTKYIDKRMINTPGVALDQTNKELVRMGRLSKKSVDKAGNAFLKEDEELIADVLEIEDVIDDLEHNIVAYLAEISNSSLSEDDVQRVNGFLNIVDAVESMGDYAENIVELAEYRIEHELEFSKEAEEDIKKMLAKADKILDASIDALENLDRKKCEEILELEGEIDTLEADYRNGHLGRLNAGDCMPVSGVVFLDLLKDVEHLGDQATNVAHSILEDLK
jgi:phosphate:Na+ symporter